MYGIRAISIHAPRGGSDPFAALRSAWFSTNFNPRSPWGERRLFLLYPCRFWQISIHAPRGGSDYRPGGYHLRPPDFNPRSPWGERLDEQVTPPCIPLFQSTLPVGGATLIHPQKRAKTSGISIHAPRGGSDPPAQHRQQASFLISIHAPRGGSDAVQTVEPGVAPTHRSARFQSTLPVGGATIASANDILFS